MTLDLATLLVALTMAAVALAVPVLFVAWRGRLYQGLMLWGVGLVLNALSYPAFGLRTLGWTDLSIILANLLTGLTLVLHTLAVATFQQERTSPTLRWLIWLPLVLNMLAVLVLLHNDPWRNILISAAQSLMALVFLREAWGPGLQEQRPTGRRVLIGGVLLLVVALLARTVFMVLASDWDAQYNVPHQVQAMTYFVVMGVVLVNSMGFVLMQMEHALERQRGLATHDALTGLYNRTALPDLLGVYGAQARRDQLPLAFLMLDIDHFKRVNDAHGHLVGDAVLREVAHRIRLRMRHSDSLARFGGEEFLAILPATDGPGAVRLAEEIRQSIEDAPMMCQGQAIAITISIGVHAGIPGDAANALDLMIDQSDRALYVAKSAGRNRVVLG